MSKIVSKKFPSPFTTPVFFSTPIIITILVLLDIQYEEYTFAKEIMTYLLGPATVALAVPLYKNREIVFKNILPVGLGLTIGSFSSILSGVLLAKVFGLSNILIASISVKSSTTPVAIEISKIIGGDPALTVAFVIITGIAGTMIGPWLMNLTKITNPLSRGLALGTIAHGQGTAEAAQEGELQGAVSGVAMGLGAIFTAFVAPIVISLIL